MARGPEAQQGLPKGGGKAFEARWPQGLPRLMVHGLRLGSPPNPNLMQRSQACPGLSQTPRRIFRQGHRWWERGAE